MPTKKVSTLLASDSSVKDQPTCSLYIKFAPEQKVQVARHAMESSNKRAIARHSSVGHRSQGKYCQDVEVEIQESIASPTEALSIQNAAKSYTRLSIALWGRTRQKQPSTGENAKHKRKLSIHKSQN